MRGLRRWLCVCGIGAAALVSLTGPASALVTPRGDSYPEDAVPDDVTGWNTLNRALMLRGIHLAAVNWTQINPLCGAAAPTDPASEAYRAYRHCQYRAVMRREYFLGDRALCERDAERRYNSKSAVLYKQPDTVKVTTDATGAVTKTTRETGRAPSLKQLRQLRLRYINDCMDEQGWVNPDNWLDGRR